MVAAAALLAAFSLWLGYLLSRPRPIVIPPESLVVTVVNVGHGEAAWIKTPSGRFIVLGAGPPGAGQKVAASLKAAGARRIDLLLLPYPYAEALGGAPDLMRALPVAEAMDNGWVRLNAHQEETRSGLNRQDIPLRVARAGQQRTVGGARIEILAPAEPLVAQAPTAANNSLVVRVRWGDTSFLFMGGCERGGEEALLASASDLTANWLRIARFGTREASSPELLRAVSPEQIVISVGPNKAGYPHAETLERLSACGASVFRTDQSGRDLVFVSDGKSVQAAQ